MDVHHYWVEYCAKNEISFGGNTKKLNRPNSHFCNISYCFLLLEGVPLDNFVGPFHLRDSATETFKSNHWHVYHLAVDGKCSFALALVPATRLNTGMHKKILLLVLFKYTLCQLHFLLGGSKCLVDGVNLVWMYGLVS